jgi:hypothetical protein
MTKLISTLSATVVLLVLGVVSADAGSWSSSWTGPYGVPERQKIAPPGLGLLKGF